MDDKINRVLAKYVAGLSSILSSHLQKVILYGSYARGDYREDSDIDIMILVDLDNEELKEVEKEKSNYTFEMNFDNDIQIMPVIKNILLFNQWVRAYPFFNNVHNEGVELYAA